MKAGGAQLEKDDARAELAEAVAAARRDGIEVILVHGGGPQIRSLSRRLGVEDRYHDGLRITDAETSEIALMTLGGTVGRKLALALEQAGVRAVSLTGADGRVLTARVHHPGGMDLGYVGVPERVRTDLLEALLALGSVPVVASVAPLEHPDPEDPARFYNVNADHMVAPLAKALDCHAVLFVTDVDAVRDGAGAGIGTLTPAQAEALTEQGVLEGGMIPKVRAALDAAGQLPSACVKIVPGGPDALRRALGAEMGTRVVGEDAPEARERVRQEVSG